LVVPFPDDASPELQKRIRRSLLGVAEPDDVANVVCFLLSDRALYMTGSIVVAPNGDLIHVSFSTIGADTETDRYSSMIITRLRRGSDQWDMPELFYDLADIDDQSAMLWNDDGKLWFFGGGRAFGDVRFRFRTSTDNGATWTKLSVPYIKEQKAYAEAQPITSAFRGPDRSIYFGADGRGADSLLWASSDEGRTWFDTGGRTPGRHTTFVVLRDGRILAMGGKSSDIEGYMPKAYSKDWGKSWSKPEKTEFAALGGNQRPIIIRLKSGRLFFAGDFQFSLAKKQLMGGGWGDPDPPPASIKERGSYVALSDDEGQTWHIKKLAMALPHESRQIPNNRRAGTPSNNDYGTLGYVGAAQGANGVIHLMTSMNHPSMHFEMNEAWILSDVSGEANQEWEGSTSKPQRHVEKYSNGNIKAEWSSLTAANGDYVLNGKEIWYYPDRRKKYEVTYAAGRKIGIEAYWLPNGTLKWKWEHRQDGTSVWTQFWPGGTRKAESTWRNFRAEGIATRWDKRGNVIETVTFKGGAITGK